MKKRSSKRAKWEDKLKSDPNLDPNEELDEDLSYITPMSDMEEDAEAIESLFVDGEEWHPSDFTEMAIFVRSDQFSFDGREYLRSAYDSGWRRLLLKFGRQSEKSTLLGNRMLSMSCLIPGFRCLYVSPTGTQTKTFSMDRLREPMETSPPLKAFWPPQQNIFLKRTVTRSQIDLRHAYLTADRTRGIPADLLAIDEIQDIIQDNIPVMEECLSHSEHRLQIESGTPKTLDNPLEQRWQEDSTQKEWVIPCRAHGTPKNPSSWYWNILNEDNIGNDGLVCAACGRRIHASDPEAHWEPMREISKSDIEDNSLFDGYHVSQLMVPWADWTDILDKQRRYSKQKFYNEVLGLSEDYGMKPITREQLKATCSSQYTLAYDAPQGMYGQKWVIAKKSTQPLFAGIDWGTGDPSHTVVAIGGYFPTDPKRLQIAYVHRFEGPETEPGLQIDLLKDLIERYNVTVVGCDYGGGFGLNEALMRRFGHKRVVRFQYVENPKAIVRWDDKKMRYMFSRSEAMSALFDFMKRRKILLPRWEEFENPYAKDILNIFAEYNEVLRKMQYKHAKGETDDTFHAIMLCWLSSLIIHRDPEAIRALSPKDPLAIPSSFSDPHPYYSS